jgi:TRAP transporter TAXI family solute receptor
MLTVRAMGQSASVTKSVSLASPCRTIPNLSDKPIVAGCGQPIPFKRSPHTGDEAGQMKAVGFLCAPLRILTRVAVVTLNLMGLASAQATPGAETFVSIGSGEMTAVYYSAAKAICQAIFSDLREQGFWCSAETTPGSAYNVERVVSGELEFAIVQSDVLFSAYKGIGRWDGKPVTDLRSVLSLFPELVTVVARADANIHVLADLAGKRLAVGSLATGPRITWDLVSPDLPLTTLPRMTVLTQSEMTSALCNGTVDADFFVVAHPSELISNRLAACPSNFVGLRAPVVDKLVSKYPFYTRRFIPTELYHVPDTVLTFGPVATLVTSASSDPRMVATIAKAILNHVAELKGMQPVLADLDAEQMIAQTLTAPVPLHPAAAAIYEKQGLIK